MQTFFPCSAALSLALAFTGCAFSHDGTDPAPTGLDGPDAPTQVGERPDAFARPSAAIAMGCFESGGALELVAAIDNDDVAEHGDLLTFAVAPDRRIAVAAEDGTVKLWTLDGFVGELDPGAFLYGAEVDRAQVLDLGFWGEQIVVADVQGLVSAWTMEGGFRVLGGTDPDIRIEAVAMDVPRGRLAHSDERPGGNIMVRGLEDATTFGPLATELRAVSDLAYLADGRLLVAGGAEAAGLEVRDANDPTITLARWTLPGTSAAVREVAVGPEALVAVHEGFLGAFDAELVPAWEASLADHAPRSVAVAGDLVYTVGAEGSLAAWSLADGSLVARVDVADPIAVRVDPAAGVVLVGSRDGALRAFDCRE